MRHRIALALFFVAGVAIAGPDTWVPIGPAPIQGFSSGGVTGRAGPIAVNPDNTDQVWIGTASGGVWYSPNAGFNWYPVSDKQASLAIGSLVLDGCDSSGCATIYAGTGENAIRRDTFHGAGLLVGSITSMGPPPQIDWTLVDGGPSATGGPPVEFRGGSIHDLVLDSASNVLYLTLSSGVTASPSEATVTAPEPSSGYGIYKTTDNGATWTRLTIDGTAGAKPTDLEIDPDDPSLLYAGFEGRGIFKKTATGWCPLNPGISAPTCVGTTGLPDVGTVAFDHVELEIFDTPSGPNRVFATFGHCSKPLLDSCEPSLYRSLSDDTQWQLLRAPQQNPDPLGCISSYTRYTHALTAHPTSSQILYHGGIRLCRSQDGGSTFFLADTNTVSDDSHFEGMLHYDHHEVVYDPADVTRLYATNDGGFAVSVDGGFHWTPANYRLQITGMHSVATAPGTPVALGGSQDNGCMIWSGSPFWESTRSCADGGSTLIDVDDPKNMFAVTNAAFDIGWFAYTHGALWSTKDPSGMNADPRSFYPPLAQDPNSNYSPLYFGTNRLYKSNDKGGLWLLRFAQPLSSTVQTEIHAGVDVISAIGVAPTDGNRVYVGYYGGGLFHEDYPNNIGTWLDRSVGLPDAPITGIAVHPADRDTVYVSLSGFGHPHVWTTSDGGVHWAAAVDGLPDAPANTIVFDQTAPYDLWLGLDGNDSGDTLYRLLDGTTTWAPYSEGLPNAPVFSISIDETRDRVFAATHGRGVFLLGGPSIHPHVAWRLAGVIELPVYAANLTPDQDCTIEVLLADGTPCASGATDAADATIRTDAKGMLVTSKDGMYQDRPLAWACHDGACAGGADLSDCQQAGNPVTDVRVDCGAESATAPVIAAPSYSGPPSSRVAIRRSGGGSGAISVVPILQAADGTPESLCAVRVPLGASASPRDDLQDVLEEILESGCSLIPIAPAMNETQNLDTEDIYPLTPTLALETPTLSGAEVFPGMHVEPGAASGDCFALAELGDPVFEQARPFGIRFGTLPGGSAGGSITVTEISGLGTCTVTVPTTPGQTGDEIATALAAAFQEPGIPGPHPECPSRSNPRDAHADGSTLTTVTASQLTVCLSDSSVGFFLAPPGLGNVHPAAWAGVDSGTECTGPAGAAVTLDGSLSTDADSTPGTNDDIVSFEWFEDYGTASETFLGNGSQLNVPLALGAHAVTLRVTDTGGLTDTRTVVKTVVDTVAPAISLNASPLELWPPNHRMVDVSVTPVASDLCATPVVTLSSVTSDEPDDAPGAGDGETISDIQEAAAGTPDFSFRLRAERDRAGSGRAYTADYRAIDPSGNESSSAEAILVPLEIDGTADPLTLRVQDGAGGTVVDWDAVEGAGSYDVIRGNLAAIQAGATAIDLGPVVCVETGSVDTSTNGDEDNETPAPGGVFVYLVQYDGTGYGSESAPLPREAASGACGGG